MCHNTKIGDIHGPILIYGLDVISLTTTQINDLNTVENNMIKSMLGISICCHHTELLYAVGVKNFELILRINKLNLVSRLLKNEYTSQLLVERIKQDHRNNLVNINDIWRDTWIWLEAYFDEEYDTKDVIMTISLMIQEEKIKFRHRCKHDEYVEQIRRILMIEKSYIRRRTLQEFLIPLQIVLNDN